VGAAGVSEEKEKVEKREKLGGVSSRSHLGDGKASGQVDKQCKRGSESAARWGRQGLFNYHLFQFVHFHPFLFQIYIIFFLIFLVVSKGEFFFFSL
jgi:hypothetical protein